VRRFGLVFVVASVLWMAACGGGNGSSSSPPVMNQSCSPAGQSSVTVAAPAANVQPLLVDAGPEPQTFVAANEAYTSVTICVPGTNTCQTIDHVQVDTGSEGLRLLQGVLTVSLPQETDSSGNPLEECLVFADGYIWGQVATADVAISGEQAASLPVHVILPPNVQTPPSSCSSQNPSGGAGNEGGSVSALGANGIIGVGPFQQDCGTACTPGFQVQNVYYSCPSSGCTATSVPLAQQVTNPVAAFATDNNGVIVQLPAVPDGGSLSVNGAMVFGIGTQSNNGLGSATVYAVNNSGDITTVYNGTSYPNSFIDSGSNGLFFLTSSSTGVPTCSGQLNSWYCPSNPPQNFSACNQGTNMSTPVTVNFSLEDATTLFNTSNTAFSTLGGPYSQGFDWGLPFFYGRNVFTAIEGSNTPAGAGPYFAY